MRFDSQCSIVGHVGTWTAPQVETEAMFLGADFAFAMAHGGPIAREFLQHVPESVRGACVVDSRTHMLMRGWYPCIPGWHHDDVPRSGVNGQPDYDAPAYHAQHLACVVDAVDAATESLTEFMGGSLHLPWPVPDDTPVYGAWDAYIDTMRERPMVRRVESGEVISFDCDTFHRGIPARRDGWRFFIRASWDTHRPVLNKLRRNANVYLPAVSRGW